MDDVSLFLVDIVFYVAGVGTIVAFANNAFVREEELKSGIKVPNRFLARAGSYNLGRLGFIGLALLIYFLAVEVDQFRALLISLSGQSPDFGGGGPNPEEFAALVNESAALADKIGEARREANIAQARTADWLELITIPILINALLAKEFPGNPFSLFRKIFRFWVAIPKKVEEISHRLSEFTPSDERLGEMSKKYSAKEGTNPKINSSHFERGKDDPVRIWAKVHHLIFEMDISAWTGEYARFFYR